MPPSKFDLEHRVGFYVAVASGATTPDAAEAIDLAPDTAREWLKRGRAGAEGDEEFAEFAAVVDALVALERAPDPAPLNREELLVAVSKSARRGSVAAQKLVWEILRNGNGNSGAPTSPLDAVDRIAAGRSAVNS